MTWWITQNESAKTDWTLTDYINFYDFNRIEYNTNYLYEELVALGYAPALSTQTLSRTKSSLVFFDNLNIIESNIKALADASYTPTGWVTPKTNWASVTDTFSYTDANRIEGNLVALETMINRIKAGLLYTGDTEATIAGKGNTVF